MKKFTAKDVFEQIDFKGRPHGGPWHYDSPFRFYEEKCDCDDHKTAIPFLESIAESLSMDGTSVE